MISMSSAYDSTGDLADIKDRCGIKLIDLNIASRIMDS